MPIFVIFVFASVVFGAGAMLAPALPTPSPRIGLAAALALAFVLAGTIFYAELFGWSTLVIDYLWFALIVGIFLTGTLSAGMFRAEADGGVKEYKGWPGPRELAFFLTIGILFAIPALVLPVPMNTEAQTTGYLALMLRSGGGLNSLAPYHPEITYFISPGLPVLFAYLSQQLHASIANVQLGIGAVLSILFVWVAYDFGNELDPDPTRKMGIAMAICSLIGTGLLTVMLASHEMALLAMIFAMAFLTFLIRFQRDGRRADFIAAAVTLACVPLSSPEMTFVVILTFIPAILLFSNHGWRRWLALVVGIPLLALIGIAPWLAKISLTAFTVSTLANLLILIVYHGGVIVLLSLIGILLRTRHDRVYWFMLIWLILIIAFSNLSASISWYGPIIPYLYFGALGLLWIVKQLGDARVIKPIRAASLPIMAVMILLGAFAIPNIDTLVATSKNTPIAGTIAGAYASPADLEAMNWLATNTDPDALILNHPGPGEGDWVSIISGRNTVYFPRQPFYHGTESAYAMQDALRTFWQNPGDPTNITLLIRYHVSYIIVPQVITRPETLSTMFRWRPPLPDALRYGPIPANVPYLVLLHDFEGAQIWQVKGDIEL